ncbi:MAG: hypothetical protein U0S36_06310 [Candidatus Nanopelagicales bacterium]
MAVLDRPAEVDQAQSSEPAGAGRHRAVRGVATDVSIVLVLTVLGLLGFGTSFGGWAYLAVGTVAAVIGAALAVAAVAYRQPGAVLAALGLVVLVALAAVIALRSTAVAGLLPTLKTVVGLGQGLTGGWRELVTTPPPVGNVGNLLAIPYVCGFASGLLGVWGALRSSRLWWGVLPPVTVLAIGILTGVQEPASLLLQGAVFAAVVVAWASIRARRSETVVVATKRGRSRVLTGVALVVAASCIGLVVGPRLPGANDKPRLLLRTYVEPDLTLSVYPSPLSATRRSLLLQKDAVLFTVAGLPQGERVRPGHGLAGRHGHGRGGRCRRRCRRRLPTCRRLSRADRRTDRGRHGDDRRVQRRLGTGRRAARLGGCGRRRQNDVRGGFRTTWRRRRRW